MSNEGPKGRTGPSAVDRSREATARWRLVESQAAGKPPEKQKFTGTTYEK